jgi:hypothetical protein
MNLRTIWTVAAAGVVAFVAWLWLKPPPPLPVAEPRPPARVALPPVPASAPDPALALAELSSSTLWGPRTPRVDAAAAAASAAAEPAWFLAGVYGQAGQRVVVVRFDGQARPALQLRVGQRLPDGARIDAIEIDRVQVRPASARGRPRTLWLPVNRGLPLPDN